ncbi:hypothetical protein SAMN05444722_2943 [Rhodovulum sp. ES.010]|uniref:imelysin family protein n=1 Tax=Rhodovulum sp. ES.010 TaxID=1882821 RepID=UPI000929823D|nr:imelysin family protein [Rhodovulum sp. ES.010]SIO51488.1 hypothetical protein SAMN05444722_2943 [Rhodovulum sp. ES.010]
MLRGLMLVLALMWFKAASAEVPLDKIVGDHVIAGFARLAEEGAALDAVAAERCAPGDAALRNAWAGAFDAWLRVSHLRFGPTETDDRAFALAFWPDSRGATPRALSGLIAERDPVIEEPDAFATVSIAARGFYAMEFLLHDPAFAGDEAAAYRCALVRAIARDIAAVSRAILADWRTDYAASIRTAGRNETYRSREEAAQEFFKALSGGLQFTSDTRLGRPLGTFERPRPTRAEARRSGRSLHHVALSLAGTRELALLLAADHPGIAARIGDAYDRAFALADELNDPVFAGVETPAGRLRVEILQQAIDRIREIVARELGPTLGVAAGFNALDGD